MLYSCVALEDHRQRFQKSQGNLLEKWEPWSPKSFTWHSLHGTYQCVVLWFVAYYAYGATFTPFRWREHTLRFSVMMFSTSIYSDLDDVSREVKFEVFDREKPSGGRLTIPFDNPFYKLIRFIHMYLMLFQTWTFHTSSFIIEFRSQFYRYLILTLLFSSKMPKWPLSWIFQSAEVWADFPVRREFFERGTVKQET